MTYMIDLDLPKIILSCPGVTHGVLWRVSPSGKGFHLKWTCDIPDCGTCLATERIYDDQKRQERDQQRQPHQRRVLWDVKGGRKAGNWHHVQRGNITKGLAPK